MTNFILTLEELRIKGTVVSIKSYLVRKRDVSYHLDAGLAAKARLNYFIMTSLAGKFLIYDFL
jgi:hypothetical protein